MVSTLNLDEKYNRVRRNFCFYLDIHDHGLARSLSQRIQDMGLQQEVFLTSRVSHVVRARGGGARRDGRRAGAMLERARASHAVGTHHHYVTLSVQKAINLLDKLYDTFFAASRRSHVRLFTKQFIKIEFLDKSCRPVFKEFDEWPAVCLDVDPPREKKESPPNPATARTHQLGATQKMTRKSRPRIKEKEEEPKGGYCEMCNSEYLDVAAHRRSPHHLAFVRDAGNYLALDSLIGSGADVPAFLDKATPVNGERRSLRKMCNGDLDAKGKRSKRSQSPDSTVDGSPRRNGALDEERRHNTRCSRKAEEDKQYYKVVGVSTKLRSSGGFAKRKESPPAVNGGAPLVVKFRKVRRSELSVLSDEAEQFMFPKRASSSSSTSSDEDERRRSPPRAPAAERRRLARPLALKEDSSEEDGWEDPRRRKRRAPAVKRARRLPCKTVALELPPRPAPPEPAAPAPAPQPEPSPLREEADRCMKWEDGRLKYTPAVEQLEFAFESVPRSEPWYETFQRQDQDKVLTRNVPRYFALYSTASPKLPYEIGQLPPLKPNCCPLSELSKPRPERPGPSRCYGTRGMQGQKVRKRAAFQYPRKSPREHASTRAGSVGLRRLADDARSTASEDAVSETHSSVKAPTENQQASERLKQFLSEVFSDAAELDACEPAEGGDAVTPSSNQPDVSSLFSECDTRDLIRDEIQTAKPRRGRFKRKKNRTGWPNKKKKGSRTNSSESEHKAESVESAERTPGDETALDTLSEDETDASGPERGRSPDKRGADEAPGAAGDVLAGGTAPETADADSSDKLLIDLKVVVEDDKPEPEKERKPRSSGSEEERELRKKRRALAGLCDWLPVVRVARVEPAATRRLRSAARAPARLR